MVEVSIFQLPKFQQMIARHEEKQENMAQTKEENKSLETNTEDSYISTSPNTEFNATFLKLLGELRQHKHTIKLK